MKHKTPADIERTSMEIISAELAEQGIVLHPSQAPVVRRVIHATADFDYVNQLRFTPDSVERLVERLRQGTVIVTDTNMARSGISKRALEQLGCGVHCLMGDADVAELAAEQGITRAVASMRLASERYPNALYVIGNAPTALLELSAMTEQGFRPAGVIGVPVGFVNVVESKEEMLSACEQWDIPGIFVMGRKGGSTVAAAVVNALLYIATDTLDPARRGWH